MFPVLQSTFNLTELKFYKMYKKHSNNPHLALACDSFAQTYLKNNVLQMPQWPEFSLGILLWITGQNSKIHVLS